MIKRLVILLLGLVLLCAAEVAVANGFSATQFLSQSPQVREPLKQACPLIYKKMMQIVGQQAGNYKVDWISFRISSSTVHRFTYPQAGVCHCEHNPKYHKGFQCTFTKH